jgi:hypothetical protein
MVIDKIVHIPEACITPTQTGYLSRQPLRFVLNVMYTQTPSKLVFLPVSCGLQPIWLKKLGFTETLHGKQPMADKRSGCVCFSIIKWSIDLGDS